MLVSAPTLVAAWLANLIYYCSVPGRFFIIHGFSTRSNHHFLPQALLDSAIGYVWRGGIAPPTTYHYVEETKPENILIGQFARWVDLYPARQLQNDYKLIYEVGYFSLFQLKK